MRVMNLQFISSQAHGGMMQAEKKQAALNAFQMQDLDRSGYIDVREFYAALSAMGLGLSWVCA